MNAEQLLPIMERLCAAFEGINESLRRLGVPAALAENAPSAPAANVRPVENQCVIAALDKLGKDWASGKGRTYTARSETSLTTPDGRQIKYFSLLVGTNDLPAAETGRVRIVVERIEPRQWKDKIFYNVFAREIRAVENPEAQKSEPPSASEPSFNVSEEVPF